MRKPITKFQQKGKDQVIIQHYSYLYSQLIGSGNQSKVYKGRNNLKNCDVAIKVIQTIQVDDNLSKGLLKNSLNSLQKLKGSPHILQLHEIMYTDKQIFVITELCSTDLKQCIKKGITQNQSWKYLRQIINGFQSFYGAGIVHRDLKPDNIFLNSQDKIKIGDLGFAAPLHAVRKQIYFNIGSPIYMAPQIFSKNEYSHDSDIWAIGITFYEILTGNPIWSSKKDQIIKREMNEAYINGKISKSRISCQAKQLLKRMLIINRYQRISVKELLNYFQSQTSIPIQQNILSIQQQKSNLSTNITTSSQNITTLKNPCISKNQVPSPSNYSITPKKSSYVKNRPNSTTFKEKEHQNIHIHSAKKIRDPLFHFLSPKKVQSKLQNFSLKRTLMPITNRAKSSVYDQKCQKSHKSQQNLSKISAYFIKMCESIFQFLQHLNSQLQIPANFLKRSCGEQIPLMKVCLMNILVKLLYKLINPKQSKIFLVYASVMDVISFLSCQQYKLLKQQAQILQNKCYENKQISKYMQKAKQQKIQGAINATVSFLGKLQSVLKSRYKRKQSLKLIDLCLNMLERMVDHISQQKFELNDEVERDEVEDISIYIKEKYEKVMDKIDKMN